MTAVVPLHRNNPSVGDILAGKAVRGSTWQDIATLVNWILGRGSNVIPGYIVGVETVQNTEYSFFYRVRHRFQTRERQWAVGVMRDDGVGICDVRIPESAASVTDTLTCPGDEQNRQNAEPATAQREIVTRSEAETTISISIEPTTSAKGGSILHISCFDIPRPGLETATADDGTDVDLLRASQPITREALEDVITECEDSDMGRRASLIQWAVPAQVDQVDSNGFAANTTSTSDVDLWPVGGIPVLGRKINRGDTTTTATVSFWAWMGAATDTGRIRANSSKNGASSYVAVTGTTPTWYQTTVTIDAEDMDSTNGLQTAGAPTFDLLQVQYKTDAGTDTVYLASVSVWED